MSFLSGALGGYADESMKERQGGKKGLLSKLRKSTDTQNTKTAKKVGAGGMSQLGEPAVPQFKKGGRVRKTGLAKVHKGERVLTKKQAKRYKKRKSKER